MRVTSSPNPKPLTHGYEVARVHAFYWAGANSMPWLPTLCLISGCGQTTSMRQRTVDKERFELPSFEVKGLIVSSDTSLRILDTVLNCNTTNFLPWCQLRHLHGWEKLRESLGMRFRVCPTFLQPWIQTYKCLEPSHIKCLKGSAKCSSRYSTYICSLVRGWMKATASAIYAILHCGQCNNYIVPMHQTTEKQWDHLPKPTTWQMLTYQ